jgi:putative spermidine/putrescine transport system ATP-binding protein
LPPADVEETVAELTLTGLTKRYGDGPPAVDALDLTVAEGEFIALLGPSGCGKTTTLRIVAGLVPPDAGEVRLGGRDITALPVHRRDIGLVFQSYALFPHMTAGANVGFGVEMRGLARAERDRRVAEALRMVRLEGLAHRKPRELSGGQQQRVALARAIAIRPSLLLLDECLSNLDAKLREEMRGEIRDIQREAGITAVFVTHDQTEALAMCDRVAVMREGRIVQTGTPEEVYERPATPFVASFLGRMNRIVAPVTTAQGLLAPGQVAMVRPHRVRILRGDGDPNGAENRAEGTVRRITYIGDIVQVEAETPLGRLAAEVSGAAAEWRGLAPGAPVRFAWAAADTLAFAERA